MTKEPNTTGPWKYGIFHNLKIYFAVNEEENDPFVQLI